jgi:hypothetical protein
MTGLWYHRGPCSGHHCSVCGGADCYVWHDDTEDCHAVHICAAGCDGWPPALLEPAA